VRWKNVTAESYAFGAKYLSPITGLPMHRVQTGLPPLAHVLSRSFETIGPAQPLDVRVLLDCGQESKRARITRPWQGEIWPGAMMLAHEALGSI
jgi:hypothetical protein